MLHFLHKLVILNECEGSLFSVLFIDSLTLAPTGVDLRFALLRRVVEGLPEKCQGPPGQHLYYYHNQ